MPSRDGSSTLCVDTRGEIALKRSRWISLLALALVAIAGFLVARSSGDSPLDAVEARIGSDCGELHRHGQSLMIVYPEGDIENSGCLRTAGSAAGDAGLSADEVDAVFQSNDGGVVIVDGVRVSLQVEQLADPGGSVWFVEFADCGRTLVPVDRGVWAAGIPWGSFWYSPCDTDFKIWFNSAS
jgi:hypothetical protein